MTTRPTSEAELPERPKTIIEKLRSLLHESTSKAVVNIVEKGILLVLGVALLVAFPAAEDLRGFLASLFRRSPPPVVQAPVTPPSSTEPTERSSSAPPPGKVVRSVPAVEDDQAADGRRSEPETAPVANIARLETEGHGLFEAGRFSEAVPLLRTAAQAGSPVAQADLAALYLTGRGVPYDTAEAGRLIRLAAAQGYDRAQFDLYRWYASGSLTRPSGDEWRGSINRLVEQGYPPAIDFVAGWYRGGLGVPRDPSRARELYTRAAERGYTPSLMSLGEIYRVGDGVTPDYSKSAEYFQAVADHGGGSAAHAMYQLAFLYLDGGPGLARDRQEAIRWLERSAGLGHEDARRALSELDP